MRPDWLDQLEYPFQPYYFSTEAGKLHYIAEGAGAPIVMVHGTPVWSFLYRNMIRNLSKEFRCIAPDHLGFGLSGKPKHWKYSPEAHADNLAQLIDYLQLKNIILIVHDFGGPIGLSYALKYPENVQKVVMFNIWMWPLDEYPDIAKAGKIAAGSFGRFLYKYFNFSPKVLIRQAFYDRRKLTKRLHQQYIKPFPTPGTRQGPIKLAKHLLASGDWYKILWQQREKLRDKPVLVIWGVKDKFLDMRLLKRWEETLPQAEFVELEAGHFVQEEKSREVSDNLHAFLAKNEATFKI